MMNTAMSVVAPRGQGLSRLFALDPAISALLLVYRKKQQLQLPPPPPRIVVTNYTRAH